MHHSLDLRSMLGAALKQGNAGAGVVVEILMTVESPRDTRAMENIIGFGQALPIGFRLMQIPRMQDDF